MASRRKGKRGGRPPHVAKEKAALALSTLAADDLIGGSIVNASSNSANYLISGDFTMSMRGHTADEGPIVVGVANGAYSDAEIEEWLEATAGFGRSDPIQTERMRRQCRVIGTFSGASVTEALNDGKPIRVKLGFLLPPATALRGWAYNEGAALTTGTVVEFGSKVYYRPTA